MKTACLLFLAATCLVAQTPTPPTWIAGIGGQFFGPGTTATVDIDYRISGAYYAHVAISQVALKHGQVLAVFQPGIEARTSLMNANVGIGGNVAAGLATSSQVTLSTFAGKGYLWWNLTQTFKALRKLGNWYLEAGGSVAGGSTSTATSGQPLQLIPQIELRIGE